MGADPTARGGTRSPRLVPSLGACTVATDQLIGRQYRLGGGTVA